ncbi:hypothetical protein [Pseudomonas putida]|uniref:hypothetical protein n=1 Tax=Pseudomonas putida TaxID=303 RepID=UPI0002DBD1A0|nr:hypothetical protein [Pseudomonas putida]
MTTPTAAITLTQIAALADLGPDYFSRHAADLPPTHAVPTGARGRPQKAFDADDLAALIVERTGHLSEAIVRLRLALAMGSHSHRIVEVGNRSVLVRDSECLQDLDEATRQALLDQIHADNAAASQARTRRTTPAQEQQP